MRVSLSNEAYRDQKKLTQFWAMLSDRLQQLPGIESGTAMSGLPPVRAANQNDTDIENFVQRPNGPVQNVAFYQTVGDRFFETLGVRLVEGRFFDARDGANAPPSVVVNQTMARTFWPGESAIGKRVRPSGAKDWATIVGVVSDIRNGGLDKPAGTEIFLPARQGLNAARTAWVTVRTAGNPRDAVETIRRVVRDIDPSLPVSSPRTMDQVLGEAQSRPRFLALILTIFSTLALTLAAFGIYGVISYSVAQRTTEFGIRMALGAQPGDVQRLVVREGAVLAIGGVVVGALGALALTRSMEGLLFSVDRFDFLTFGGMALLLTAVALIASWVPAVRATAVDPIKALRYE
jgi:predicted permease